MSRSRTGAVGAVTENGKRQCARNDPLSVLNSLRASKRERTLGFEVEAKPPFAVDPDAPFADLLPDVRGEMAIAIPMLVINERKRKVRSRALAAKAGKTHRRSRRGQKRHGAAIGNRYLADPAKKMTSAAAKKMATHAVRKSGNAVTTPNDDERADPE